MPSSQPVSYHGLGSRSWLLDPARTVAELEELRELTGDENGAQRVAWTDTWERAREWLRGKLAGTGAVEEIDAGREPVVHAARRLGRASC